MNAYNELYLEDAANNLGGFFDYMVHSALISLDRSFAWLANSVVGQQFEKGNPTYIGGMSGAELAGHLLHEITGKWHRIEPMQHLDRSKEYWAGWALAHYQWRRGVSFKQMIEYGLTASRVCDMYILHESDISKFIQNADIIVNETKKLEKPRLKRLRCYCGYTQKQLSEKSGVSLRMVQLYEQGRNDLFHAQAGVVMELAKALNCTVEELL